MEGRKGSLWKEKKRKEKSKTTQLHEQEFFYNENKIKI
jgi:hypothetical protein